jgi:hypothetical protein
MQENGFDSICIVMLGALFAIGSANQAERGDRIFGHSFSDAHVVPYLDLREMNANDLNSSRILLCRASYPRNEPIRRPNACYSKVHPYCTPRRF